MRHYAAIWSDKRLLGAVAFVIVARMVTWSYIELGTQSELAATAEAQRVRPAPAPPLPAPSAKPRKALVLPDLDEEQEGAGGELRVREVLPDGSSAPSPLLPLVVAGAGGSGVLLLCGVAGLLFLRSRRDEAPPARDPWYGDAEIRRLVEEREGRSP